MSLLFPQRAELLRFILGRDTPLTPREKGKEEPSRKLKQRKQQKGDKLRSVGKA
jgi:hypothetical protein